MRVVLLGLLVFALGLAAAALVASPRAGARTTAGLLTASVGPGFTISMSESSVSAGDYTISVSDNSNIHNFHLSGPGVNKATSISGTGSTSWSVTLQPGTYSFQCDAHASEMNGSLTVTSDATTSTATTTTATTTTQATTTTATTTTTTTSPTTSQAETTTEATTTTAPTTIATTTTTTTAETTTTVIVATPPLRARVASAQASGRRVTVRVTANRAGHATISLLSGKRRIAHATGKAPGKLVLHLPHPLKRGRYIVALRVTAGGKTAKASRTLRVR